MADNNGRPTDRKTILIDSELYIEAKRRSLDKKMKLYQYINFLIAKDVGARIPAYLKHLPPASIKPKKEKPAPFSEKQPIAGEEQIL